MKVFSGLVFDETISGTTTTWYTPAKFNDILAAGDALAIQATATNITGTVTLTVFVDHSADAQTWNGVNGATAAISAALPASGETSIYGGIGFFPPYLLSFARLRIYLTGTSPQCRLKLGVTSRSL